MDSQWLEKTRALRDEAFDALLSSSDYIAFKAFDDAVVRLGGSPLLDMQPSSLKAAASRVVGNAAMKMGDARRLSQADYAELALKQKNEPLPIGRLLASALEKGAVIGGSDPLANFRSTLSKDSRFVSIMRNSMYFWWFSQEPVPAGWASGAELDLGEEPAPAVGTSERGGEANATTTTS